MYAGLDSFEGYLVNYDGACTYDDLPQQAARAKEATACVPLQSPIMQSKHIFGIQVPKTKMYKLPLGPNSRDAAARGAQNVKDRLSEVPLQRLQTPAAHSALRSGQHVVSKCRAGWDTCNTGKQALPRLGLP